MQRDLRIDFLRGLALLAIAFNHAEMLVRSGMDLPPTYVGALTFSPLGGSSVAEVFFFLSGLSAGLVYSRILERVGFKLMLQKAFRRCFSLYAFNHLTLLAVIILIALTAANPCTSDINAFFTHPEHSIFNTLTLRSSPFLFRILALYIVFLFALPFFLVLHRRSPVAALVVSLLVYKLATITGLSPASLIDGAFWSSNPFAWQILFFLGTHIGVLKQQGRLQLPKGKLIVGLALSCVVVIFIADSRIAAFAYQAASGTALDIQLPWLERVQLGPLRLLHFIALAYLVGLWMPAASTHYESTRWRRRLVHVGQHALPIYLVGVLMNYVTAVFMVYRADLSTLWTLHLATLTLAFVQGEYLHRRKASQKAGLVASATK